MDDDTKQTPEHVVTRTENPAELEQARRRRADALSQLSRGTPADVQADGDSIAPMGKTRAPGMRVKWIALSALALVVVAGGILAGVARFARTAPAGTPSAAPGLAEISPRGDNLACAQDVAWSPDGTRIAVLGYLNGCPQGLLGVGAVVPGLVNVYDTRHGLASQLKPDAALRQLYPIPDALRQQLTVAGATPAATIQYRHVLWSADGKRLAITYQAFVPSGLPTGVAGDGTPLVPTTFYAGVYLSDVPGTDAHAITAPPGARMAIYTEWDLTAGKPVAVPPAMIGPTRDLSFPPALRYTWQSGGLLAGETPLSIASAPDAPPPASVGNPSGGVSFAIWQGGIVSLALISPTTTSASGSVLETPGVYTFQEHEFAAWSPDGRYLIDDVAFHGRLQPVGRAIPTEQTLKDQKQDQAPLLPVRDAGLQQVLSGMPADIFDPASQRVDVAWSPNGRWLAVHRAATRPADPAHSAVLIYDCATGKIVGTLHPSARAAGLGAETVFAPLHWSPDSSRLLLAEGGLDVTILSLWRPDQLPH